MKDILILRLARTSVSCLLVPATTVGKKRTGMASQVLVEHSICELVNILKTTVG